MAEGATSQIDIRLIRENDIEAYRIALSSVIDEQRYFAMLELPPLERTREFIVNNIKSGAAHYVACLGEEIIGWCIIATDPLRRRHAHTGGLGIGIIELWRGQGLGERLMTAAINHAREAGLLRIELSVYDSNVRARRMYEKLGFIHEGTKRKGAKFDHGFEDIHIMGLLL